MKSNSKKPLPVIEDHYDDLIPEFPQVSKVKCIGKRAFFIERVNGKTFL